MTDVRTAKAAARAWLESNRSRWPDLRGAHFVGGITALPESAPFPRYKDIDLHLIVDDGEPGARRSRALPGARRGAG
jgi:hypothetical protein